MREHRQAEQQIQGSFTKEREVASKVGGRHKTEATKTVDKIAERGKPRLGNCCKGEAGIVKSLLQPPAWFVSVTDCLVQF